MNNPFQLIQQIKNCSNPQQMMFGMLQARAKGNPMLENVLTMAKNNDTKGIEQLARNLSMEKGINPDDMVNQIKNQLGI